MSKNITMRRQIIYIFVLLVTVPILTIYGIACYIFTQSSQADLKALYGSNINEVGKSIDILLKNALDLTLYPISEQNIKNYLLADPQNPDYIGYKQNAANILISMPFGYTEGIQGLLLYTRYGDYISTNHFTSVDSTDAEALAERGYTAHWDYSSDKSGNYIYLLRYLRNPSNLSEYIGYIKLSLRCSSIRSGISQNSRQTQTSYFIISPSGDTLVEVDNGEESSNAMRLSYEEVLAIAESDENSIIREQYIVSVYPLLNTGLLLYSVTQPTVMNHVLSAFVDNMALTSVFVFLVCIVLSFRFSSVITKPLNKLSAHMSSISNANFSVRIQTQDSCSEIAAVADQFNHMAEQLEYLYEQVYLSEIRLKQSQLDMLQAQINPHFLYNTLDTIYWMAKLEKTEEVSIMVSNMSRMMRLTLAPKNQDRVSLKEELEHLSCYTAIQKIRLGSRVVFQEEIDESLLEFPVLCFLLQPLVENALTHGLVDRMEGIVQIKVYAEENAIIYEVANNGTPVDTEEIKNILEKQALGMRGFALRNISERIRLKYGSPYGLSCFIKEEFSIFKITQPKEEDGL